MRLSSPTERLTAQIEIYLCSFNAVKDSNKITVQKLKK